MTSDTYYLAEDCPQCGDHDTPWAWKGARMGSTSWGHDYMCCSEECGIAFAKNPKLKELQKEKIKMKISILQDQLEKLGT